MFAIPESAQTRNPNLPTLPPFLNPQLSPPPQTLFFSHSTTNIIVDDILHLPSKVNLHLSNPPFEDDTFVLSISLYHPVPSDWAVPRQITVYPQIWCSSHHCVGIFEVIPTFTSRSRLRPTPATPTIGNNAYIQPRMNHEILYNCEILHRNIRGRHILLFFTTNCLVNYF